MTVYFIADLHLSESRPELTDLFLRFIYGEAENAQAVYILGDLFDFWIGDDEHSALTETVKQALRHLADSGILCFFIHGNRDFLIGRRFAADSGITLLPDYYLIDLFGQKTLICHGDTLCTDDVRYQQFRRKVRQKWRQKLFLMLPLALRLRIARHIRRASTAGKEQKAAEIMDVNPQTVAGTVAEYGASLLIHGHTHRENIHRENGFTRIVLGDWKTNRASILKIDGNGFGFL